MKLSFGASMVVVAFLSFNATNLSALPVPGELEEALAWLGAAIGGVEYANSNKDQVALYRKLDSAADKIEQGKLCDAVDKLRDIQDKVVALRDATKTKIWDGESYTVRDLLDAADQAISCLGDPCR